MTPSSICSSCGNPPHEGFAKAHAIRAIRSPGGREEGNLQTCRRLRATREHVGSRPAAPRRCKCTKVVHRAHVFEILTKTSSARAFALASYGGLRGSLRPHSGCPLSAP